jgi:hypothetical protein
MIRTLFENIRHLWANPELIVMFGAIGSMIAPAAIVAVGTFKSMRDQNQQASRIENATHNVIAKTDALNNLSATIAQQIERVTALNESFATRADAQFKLLSNLTSGGSNFPIADVDMIVHNGTKTELSARIYLTK